MRPSTRTPVGSIQKNHAWLPTTGQATEQCLPSRYQCEYPLTYKRPRIGQEGPDNDLERRNSSNRIVILPNSVAFGVDYVKVVEDTPILSAAEM